jgi:hypothetical protein
MNSVGDLWFLPLGHKGGTSPDDPIHGMLIGQLSKTFFESLTIENTDTLLEPKSSRPVHNAQIQLTPEHTLIYATFAEYCLFVVNLQK